jgi:hypothetical protein
MRLVHTYSPSSEAEAEAAEAGEEAEPEGGTAARTAPPEVMAEPDAEDADKVDDAEPELTLVIGAEAEALLGLALEDDAEAEAAEMDDEATVVFELEVVPLPLLLPAVTGEQTLAVHCPPVVSEMSMICAVST